MRVLIHPGYPKTASTFLKDNLFSNHTEINFMTKSKIISDKLNLIKFLDKNFERDKTFKSENGSYKILIPEWLKI